MFLIIFLGHLGDALVNCYESQSVVASARYYRRYKRNGESDSDELEKSATEETSVVDTSEKIDKTEYTEEIIDKTE